MAVTPQLPQQPIRKGIRKQEVVATIIQELAENSRLNAP
jgi:hypothetical protein